MTTYFVDTNFFVALKNKDDENNERAEEIFAEYFFGEHGKLHTSDYVLDEAVTVVRRRTKNHKLAVETGKMISSSVMIKMKHTSEDEVKEALKQYEKYDDKDLSFTDWVIVIQIKRSGLPGIISFDKHFDQVSIKRLH